MVDQEKIENDYKNGMSLKELENKYHKSNYRIRQILKINNVLKINKKKSYAAQKSNEKWNEPETRKRRTEGVIKSYTPKLINKRKKDTHKQWINNPKNIQMKQKSTLNLSSPIIKKEILKEHNNQCNRCGNSKKLIIHHNSYLYTADKEHLSVLCIKCHGQLHKELRKKEDFFKGDNTIKRAMIEILKALNININDENFRNTPARVSRMYKEMCEGLFADNEIKEILKTKFPSEYEGMVTSQNIEVYSLCPHHFLPVKYKIHVGIIFNKECIGLSKIPRLVSLLAKKPVLQETLTQEITKILDTNLKTLGSICVVQGIHTCMQARGIKALGSSIITSSATGKFLCPDKNKNPKEEFLTLIKLDSKI